MATARCVASAPALVVAHHETLAKFDDKKPLRIRGVVTLVDWRNPHAHVFVNVKTGEQVSNWAVELESPIDLEASGWSRTTIAAGRQIAVAGIAARNGSRQMLGKTVAMASGNDDLHRQRRATTDAAPRAPDAEVARWPAAARDRSPAECRVTGRFRARQRSSRTASTRRWTTWGLLKNIADASKVAPMQPWALQLYTERQQRFLRDDPMYLNCKPPGGPRQFQLAATACSSSRTASGSGSSC